MLSVGEAMLTSLLLGAFFGVFYIALLCIRMLLGGGASLPDGMPRVVTLPLLGERTVFSPERKVGRIYREILTFLLDLLFFFFCGTALSIFVYRVGGIFRLSYATLAIMGFALFYLTLGRLFLMGSHWAFLGIKILLWYSAYIVFLPIRMLALGTKVVFLKVRLIFLLICDRIKTEIYDRKVRRSDAAFGKEWEQRIRENISRSLP